MGEPASLGERRLGTQAAYAADRGVSKSLITKWKKLGLLKAPALTPDGQVDFAEADRMLAAQLDPMKSRKAVPPQQQGGGAAHAIAQGSAPVTDLNTIRERKLTADADLAELELARRRGELVDRQGVEAMARRVAVAVRQQIESSMRPMVDAILAAGGAIEARAAFERESRAMLERLAAQMDRELAAMADDKAAAQERRVLEMAAE